jgi:hypothetical protein
MAKRVDPGDQTMELSTSQLVPDAPARPRMPPPQIAPHDASVWKQVVVGSADFAPPPKARSGRARTWAIVGAASIAAGVGGAFAWHRLADGDAPAEQAKPSPAETAPGAPKPPSPAPAAAVAVAVEAPAAGSGSPEPAGSAASAASPGSPALGTDDPPATRLADLASWLSPPEAVVALFDGLAPWMPAAAQPPPPPPPPRAAKKPAPALKKAAIAPKKPAPVPKKPVPPARGGRR